MYGPEAKDAIPALVKILDDPRDPAFPAVFETLSTIGPAADPAVPRLTELLRHNQVETCRSAAEALGRLGPATGRAVPTLVALLASDEGSPGKPLRESAAVAIGKIGKHDLPSVFDAFVTQRLPETLLTRVIESLGPADAEVAAGLAKQMGRKDSQTRSLAATGLRRIGAAAWPVALTELRILLGSTEPSIRNSASEVLDEIVPEGIKGVPPKGSFFPKASPLFDLQEALDQGGFDGRGWGHHVANFVRFGTKAEADKYLRGDQFDRIEVERGTKDHRAKLAGKAYRVAALKFVPSVRDDIEKIGLIAEIPLPFRVRGRDGGGTAGVLAGIHPSEAETGEFLFLTKDGALRPCTPQDAEVVKRNNGVLYHPEMANTTLILVFKGKLEVLKDLARNARDYSVDIELTNLRYERPVAWGCFRTDAYVAARWDCQKLWVDSLIDDRNPQPVYFPTAFLRKDPERIPEMVQARMDTLRILNKEGRVVGEFTLK